MMSFFLAAAVSALIAAGDGAVPSTAADDAALAAAPDSALAGPSDSTDTQPADAASGQRSVPTYYASEIVVFGERLAAFRSLAPDPVVIPSLSLPALATAPHITLGDYGTSAYASVRGLPTEHVAVEYGGAPLTSLQNGTFDVALLAPIAGTATVTRGPFAWLADGRPSQATLSIDPRIRPGVELATGSGDGGSVFRVGVGGDRWGARLGAVSSDGGRENTSTVGWGAVAGARTPAGDALVTLLDMTRGIPGRDDQPEFSGRERDRVALARMSLRPIGAVRPAIFATRHEQRYEDATSSPTHIMTSAGGTVTVPLGSPRTGPFGARRSEPGAIVLSYEWSLLDSSDPMNPDLGVHVRSSVGTSVAYVAGTGPLRGAARAAASYSSQSATSLSAAVGAARLWSAGRVWVTAGTSGRAPTMNELYWPANSWSAGNENLEPERLTTAEAGVEVGNDRRSAGVTAYWTEARELIVWAESANVWRPENVGSASLRGIELDAQARLGTLEIAYAADFGRATDNGSELELPYRPRVVQTLSAGALFGRLRGELRARTSDGFFVDEANSGRLDGYAVLDAAASWRLPLPGTELSLEVWNVLDEEYALRNGYAMPGRQWRVGIALGAGTQSR